MIHVGMDVHVRNSVLNANDADGQVLARGRCGNTMLEISEFLAPIERRAKQTEQLVVRSLLGGCSPPNPSASFPSAGGADAEWRRQ